MSEVKDAATMSREQAAGIVVDPGEQQHGLSPQLQPSPGLPVRRGAVRHRERVRAQWDRFSPEAQEQILAAWEAEPQQAELPSGVPA